MLKETTFLNNPILVIVRRKNSLRKTALSNAFECAQQFTEHTSQGRCGAQVLRNRQDEVRSHTFTTSYLQQKGRTHSMASKRVRKCKKCRPARTRAQRAAARSEASVAAPATSATHVQLPHHVVLEVFSYLKSRAIVRARGVARVFTRDAPALIDSLECSAGLRFPSATEMHLFPRIEEVVVKGDNDVMEQASPGLARCASLRRLSIVCQFPQQSPLPGGVTTILCGLQLSDLDIRKMRIDIPSSLAMPAWRTLRLLILRDAMITDKSLTTLVGSLPGTELPLRHLDLSRNPLGEMKGMQPLAEAIVSFPHLDILELTADRITDCGARRLLDALLQGACPYLSQLEMSLNYLGNECIDFLANGLRREDHGLQKLRKIGIGGRFMSAQGVTNFTCLGRSLAAGCIPIVNYFHVQGDVGPASVGPVLRELRSGACPKLAVVKMERSTRFPPEDDDDAVEDAIESMWELVTSSSAPALAEVHILGMNLGKGLETGWAPEDSRTFYRATSMSSFHRLAAAGAERGVMIFV